jgi:hypothetical protein
MPDGEQPTSVRYWTEWHEDMGTVLWWKWPIEEPPYVGTPLDLGHTIEVTVAADSSCGGFAGGKYQMHVGGWPFGDAGSPDREALWWTPLPDCDALDRAIREEIRGGPDPFAATTESDHA